MGVYDGRQVKQVGSWEQIKILLNENLHKKINVGSEGSTDSVRNNAGRHNYQREVTK